MNPYQSPQTTTPYKFNLKPASIGLNIILILASVSVKIYSIVYQQQDWQTGFTVSSILDAVAITLVSLRIYFWGMH